MLVSPGPALTPGAAALMGSSEPDQVTPQRLSAGGQSSAGALVPPRPLLMWWYSAAAVSTMLTALGCVRANVHSTASLCQNGHDKTWAVREGRSRRLLQAPAGSAQGGVAVEARLAEEALHAHTGWLRVHSGVTVHDARRLLVPPSRSRPSPWPSCWAVTPATLAAQRTLEDRMAQAADEGRATCPQACRLDVG